MYLLPLIFGVTSQKDFQPTALSKCVEAKRTQYTFTKIKNQFFQKIWTCLNVFHCLNILELRLYHLNWFPARYNYFLAVQIQHPAMETCRKEEHKVSLVDFIDTWYCTVFKTFMFCFLILHPLWEAPLDIEKWKCCWHNSLMTKICYWGKTLPLLNPQFLPYCYETSSKRPNHW